MIETPSPARFVLVLGGARSGKSGYAQRLAERSGRRLIYCATATIYDDGEMQKRIDRHRAERDDRWRTIEAPLRLGETLGAEAGPSRLVLVDCLTLWLTNVMLGGGDVESASADLAECVQSLRGPVIFVSNEVGSGIVPDNALGRAFRDAQGRLNQAMAGVCDHVVLVAAGLPLRLKPRLEPDLMIGPD
ncbi:bifunctional adenosylcobinamide kinase/adenosylcobinamide-phosphate guanylyltransferase [Lichenihabitans sp. PAMC28606]|uniref:bifunctional adenosylcobinamide kinase/adenosylcobinamide-phosphate guanylyltransferase n=1 Tax=Lichenihabitans sp. PAMC28606 TaxID=2880932 RepID=UPI001D0B8CE5|nr:bifunctional adenosylcobinamide kinase/adenosylcobinamide-phosphate guanylyltransferase [Lichenihabitans sp. PAMC28606]UDL93061.1 bifunctional adenosylcobinamide kinase/adenosylcobinamide-phosphate guanylyltransferase [Lichenihabitans sp. PAMC28606]